MTATNLFNKAFNTHRDPRSPEYKAGVLACLRRRIDGLDFRCPYTQGTAASDAFWAGVDEGWLIWKAETTEP